MSDTEACSESGIIGNSLVKFLDTSDEALELGSSERLHVFDEAVGFESGLHIEEYESSSQSVVDHCNASVGSIHKSDDVDIPRNIELLSGVKEGQLVSSLIGLDEHEELTEDPRNITTVDLIDDEEVLVIGIFLCFKL